MDEEASVSGENSIRQHCSHLRDFYYAKNALRGLYASLFAVTDIALHIAAKRNIEMKDVLLGFATFATCEWVISRVFRNCIDPIRNKLQEALSSASGRELDIAKREIEESGLDPDDFR